MPHAVMMVNSCPNDHFWLRFSCFGCLLLIDSQTQVGEHKDPQPDTEDCQWRGMLVRNTGLLQAQRPKQSKSGDKPRKCNTDVVTEVHSVPQICTAGLHPCGCKTHKSG